MIRIHFKKNSQRKPGSLPGRLLFLCLIFFVLRNETLAQKQPPSQRPPLNIGNSVPPSETGQPRQFSPTDTSKTGFIRIRYADELNYLVTPQQDTIQKLIGQVELNQDTVFLFCDSATILNGREMIAQGNFILQQGDSTTIFADSAEYASTTKIAELYGDVAMQKGQQKLFTDHLTYNADTKIATYLTGATLTDDTTFLQSQRGYFHARTDNIFFKDSVVVVNPDFNLRSDTLQFNARSKVVTFLAPTLIVQDTARIYTESGFYDINRKYAEFNTNPQYLKNDQKAWADKMTYDGNKSEVTLIGNAHFEDSTSMATANTIRYNEKTGVTTLEGNGFFRDSVRTFTGDTIVYDSKNEAYSTRGRSRIIDREQILDADQVDYVKEREIGIAIGNVIFRDTLENMTVFCEYAEHSKKKNYLKAHGGRDSLGNPGRPLMIREVDGDSLFISADTLVSFVPEKDSTAAALTTISPNQDSIGSDSFAVVQKGTETGAGGKDVASKLDSLPEGIVLPIDSAALVQNETLAPNIGPGDGPLPDSLPPPGEITTPLLDLLDELDPPDARPPSTAPEKEKEERIILAYHDVRIFKSDLQALCDSLSYSSLDSMFRLFDGPIIWSDTSQFTANNMRIQLANDAIDKIFLEENSFIVNTPDEVFFNQIKGRNSTAYFLQTDSLAEKTELRTVRVVGNAESVYYALDDEDAYIGVNKTVCSEMKIMFGDNEVTGIVFYEKPTSNLFPMKQADHNALELPGFTWQIGRRPRSVADLVRVKKMQQ